MGNYAGNQCTSNGNTVIGHEAGRGLTDGFRNVFVGAYAGMNNGDGVVNTYIGEEAGRDNVGGTGNTFVGDVTGMLSSGINNTFLGAGAGYDNQGSRQRLHWAIAQGNGQMAPTSSSSRITGAATACWSMAISPRAGLD